MTAVSSTGFQEMEKRPLGSFIFYVILFTKSPNMKRVREESMPSESGIFSRHIPADVWLAHILNRLAWTDLQQIVRVNKAFYALVRKRMSTEACMWYKDAIDYQRKYNVIVSLTANACIKARHYEAWIGTTVITRKDWRELFPMIKSTEFFLYNIICTHRVNSFEEYFDTRNVLIGLLKKFCALSKEYNESCINRITDAKYERLDRKKHNKCEFQ